MQYSEAAVPTISEKSLETDVCVVGGGMAGICAAVAAARNGARVILVQDRPVLGGNASSEIRVPVSGAYGDVLPNGKVLENREGGLIEEVRLENIYRNPTCNWQIWDHVLWNFCTREKNLSVLLNTTVVECASKDNRIESVTGWDLISYTKIRIAARIYIDCSGDAILRLSGAVYMKGRESKSDFNESYAPDEGNLTVMGSTLNVFSEPTGIVAETAPAPETTKPYPREINDGPSGKKTISWTCGSLEWGGEKDTIKEASDIRDELFRYSYGLWDMLQSKMPEGRDDAGRIWERTFVSSLPGKRESVRYIGDHILTQNDLLAEGRHFMDNIGHGGWPMDDHFSAGLVYPKQTIFHPCPRVYGIPFRSLYSRNIKNLMFSGRDVSVTHMALSSTRVQATCSVMGQAVGTAAAMAVRYDTEPRGIMQEHIEELQDTLQWQDQFIPWRQRKITALSREGKLSHEILRDGMDRIRLDGSHGEWLKPGDVTSYEYDDVKEFKGVRLVVDTNMDDNRWLMWWVTEKKVHSFPSEMPRDFDVQVKNGSKWETIASIKDNYRRWLDIHFEKSVKGTACRVVWMRPWGSTTEQRVFSFEVY